MSTHGLTSKLARACGKALRLASRPVRSAKGKDSVVLQPYRGYGSRAEIFLIGRVFWQPSFGSNVRDGTTARALIDVARRLLRHGLGDAVLVARFDGAEQEVTTDRDGYFRIHLRLERPPPQHLWHDLVLELLRPIRITATGELFIPPSDCRFVVISDIDDTVMETGVASKARMMWRLFMQQAESRVAFAGMAALLRALHHGATGVDLNPMLYVSRAPWSIHEVLDEFFKLHAIPVGPLLFLREWGLTLQSPLPRRAKGHKLDLIRNMLALYHDLPFVLIGDSGQRDPEIYAQVVREHPGRVLAIYIRNVSRDPERHRAIEELALEVAGAGSSLLLAADSLAMAEHAAEHGLIVPSELDAVRGEREAPQGEPPPTVAVTRSSPSETQDAVAQGQLESALSAGDQADLPPNVLVEPDGGKRG